MAEELAALDKIAEQLNEESPDPAGTDLRELREESAARLNELSEQLAERARQEQETAEELARRLVRKPLFFAGMMVKCGDAQGFVAGASQPTPRVVEAGLMTVGLAAGPGRGPVALGALRAACMKTFVTDEATAEWVLAHD